MPSPDAHPAAFRPRRRRAGPRGEGDGPRWLSEAIGPGHKLAFLVVCAALLAFCALIGVAWAAGFEQVWQRLIYPHWVWLPVALAGELVAYLGYTLAYREVARAEGGTELDAPKAAALVATGFGVFLQGGGFALDREALKRSGFSEAEARARVLGLGALEYAVLAPAAAVCAVLVWLRTDNVSTSLTLPWIIGVPTGTAVALALLGQRHRFQAGGWLRTRIAHALEALRLLLCILRRPRRYGLGVAGIALYWAGDIFCLWATLHAFYAQPPPVSQLVLGYATGYALTRRALPLGGAGVVEALLPFALGWVGIRLAPALLGVACYRLFNLWLPMIPALAGIPAIARLQQPARRRSTGARRYAPSRPRTRRAL
ncbi:MAG TPA: lysylphosphatidylglycerol synthase domain-containing protein [Gaiellaceae bacterium]